MVTKEARLRACCLVAVRMEVSFCRKVPSRKRMVMLLGGGELVPVLWAWEWEGFGNKHERMGKADFGPVDETISEAFEDGKDVVVFGVEDEGGEGLLGDNG